MGERKERVSQRHLSVVSQGGGRERERRESVKKEIGRERRESVSGIFLWSVREEVGREKGESQSAASLSGQSGRR